MDKMKMETPNLAQKNLEKLKQMFPEVFTETTDDNGEITTAVDAHKLSQALSTKVIEGDESYDFTWVGKKNAVAEVGRPIRKTLKPCKEESKNWENTENLYIEGDNLEVLKLLQVSYLNKVKMIYIDPPYNTGNDSFIYPDDYAENKDQYDEEIGAVDENGYRMFHNAETNGRFHSSWCSMMYPRLKLAKNLLSKDGVIFISIDDHEVDNLKKICDEIFGVENFIARFLRLTTKSGKTPQNFMNSHEYILIYSKSAETKFVGEAFSDNSYKYEDEFVAERGKYNLKQPLDCNSIGYSPSLDYPIEHEGVVYYPGGDEKKYNERKKGIHANKDYAWRWSKELYKFGLKNGWIVFQNGRIYTKGYLNATIDKNINGYSPAA